MAESTEKTDKLIQFIGSKFQNGELNNDTLVQIIVLCDSFLNLKTTSDYARSKGKSFNGVSRFKKPDLIIAKTKLYIDND